MPAAKLVRDSGVKGGVVVHLGVADAERTASLRLSDSYMVQGLDRDQARVDGARGKLRGKGLYGPVAVDRLNGARLPFIDNFVNLLIVDETQGISEEEFRRVLAPRGVALVLRNGNYERFTKPVPKTIDDWTHYFHDPSGNAVAHDDEVGPPRRMQWVGSPRWSRHHDRMASMSALVSAGGRLFYIMDEGSRVSIQLPSHWQLLARDAFNGTVLWKREIPTWHNQLWPLKSGPTQLARRLVATDETIFVTLRLDGPVEAIDAATGKNRLTYAGSSKAEEIVHHDGILFVMVREGDWELQEFAPKFNTGDQARVRGEFVWNARPRKLLAYDAKSGVLKWEVKDGIAPLSVVVDGDNAIYYDGDKLVCLDRESGKVKWKSDKAERPSLIPFNAAPRVVIYKDTVLFAGGDNKMKGFDLTSGKKLWEAQQDPSGYQSPRDLLVVGGLVWTASITSGKGEGVFTGLNPRTGKIEKQFPPNVETYWFHHRCYLAKATDKFIMPSRTGIEFIDHEKEDWTINHWVRGGCLYGVMPANGLTYAPPHNCACYPEAKLYGFNALAPESKTPLIPANIDEVARLERGPAFGKAIEELAAGSKDWPTFRHDTQRSGYTGTALSEELARKWQIDLGGPLSALTIAGGQVYVAQIDQHTVHALGEADGDKRWSFTAGGRVDSPPTYADGRIVFGSADGYVYCLRAKDGALIWRYRAAPTDMKHMAFEQIESVWPVHGSVLVQKGVAMFVAGRSTFLDGGLRVIKLDVRTGRKLMEKIWDNRDPETGEDIQNRLQTLQMQVGLPDILSSDGKYTYLRSQKIDEAGERLELGPVSGDASKQGGTQSGEGAHLFAPMGYLDDTYFHRAYWVYGRNFAGGHNGYYQAGKFAPAGRMLVFNDTNVFGFGREPQYLKWTTTMEHQLFSAPREIPKVEAGSPAKGGKAAPSSALVSFPVKAGLDPSEKAITVEMWVFPDGPGGVLLACGGPENGFALTMARKRPSFSVRSAKELVTIASDVAFASGWNHLAGVLEENKTMRLYLNGKEVAQGKASGLISRMPKQPMDLGSDSGSAVGDYKPDFRFTGLLDELRLSYKALSADDIASHHADPNSARAAKNNAALFCSFDKPVATDESGHKNHGSLSGVDVGKGKLGNAIWFRNATSGLAAGGKKKKGTNAQSTPSHVRHDWHRAVPMFAQAMAMGRDTLFVAGPPDIMDEEYAFERLTEKDPAIHQVLKEQDQALEGAQGGLLWAVSVKDGRQSKGLALPALPVWDGMAIANGSLFVATKDGKVTRFGN